MSFPSSTVASTTAANDLLRFMRGIFPFGVRNGRPAGYLTIVFKSLTPLSSRKMVVPGSGLTSHMWQPQAPRGEGHYYW